MQTQTRDQLREQIRQSIRDAVRGERGGDGGGAAIAGIGPQGPGGVPGPLSPRDAALQLMQAEIAGARAQVQALTESLTPGVSNARENAIESQLERATERLVMLEDQYAAVLANRAVAGTALRPPAPPASGNVLPPDVKDLAIWGMCTLGVTIISVAFIRMWSRWLERRSQAAPAAPPDVTPRLDRIEQAIEAVAIEVERVSEGQRYTNKMMHEGRALPAPGLGDRWPAVAEREPVPARRPGED